MPRASSARSRRLKRARISIDFGTEERIARALEEASDPSPPAVGLFDRGGGRFEVFAHYQEEPRRETLLELIAKAAGGEDTGALSIEDIAPEDWVTLSQGQRGPVAVVRPGV